MRAATLLVLVSTLAWARGPEVLLFPAVATPRSATLSGRVLKHSPSGGSSTMSKNLRRLTVSNWRGAKVEVRLFGQALATTSGHDGEFEVTLAAPPGAPFPVGVAVAEAQAPGADVAKATVDVIDDAAPFVVVSDYDDTLAVTGAISRRAVFRSGLLQDESTQPVVEGMADFYRCLAEPAARPGFALVSGSPVQYAARIQRFLLGNRFPVFGLYLRDLGPHTLSGYKQPVLRALAGRVAHPFVYVGDDGEKDPEVYAELRGELKARVKAIYIRRAGGPEADGRFEGMVRFTHAQEAARDAVTKGLASAACVEAAFGKDTP